ncbi:hypothetical protein PCANB_002444 [Pneumocystis canis]|nr:hypothetical protein PCK1_002443 [Pneumocystis canis]KAG5438724.1 hypothetical protein PCANB_002444 [Pneumocystis canis]
MNIIQKSNNHEKNKHLNIINHENQIEEDTFNTSLHNNIDEDLLQKELSKISFGTLISTNDKLSKILNIKEKRQKACNIKKEIKERLQRSQKKIIKKKRSKKHAPLEMSSKNPVSRYRQVVPVTIIERRDPRFNFEDRVNLTNLSSKYSFIKNYQQDELNTLKNELKNEKNHEKREKLKKAIISLESRLMAVKNKEEATKILQEHKKIEKIKIKAGKTPFFLKKREQKKLIEMNKLSKLKGTKALEKYMQKKEKKLASKERKKLSKILS